ncbi:polyprenyl synthetase family protein [Paenibacillus thalictri]|uniref:Farnesyl diphosphate synthase n=1 Tax=Paenibacillus thalictri TaxID=2527873 RepID=A0A4Q9DSN2_9BACL|nr:farnesyl diphosphate synthase [Paenibacillus thalictri]TBL79869.1 polyprenyl synthetase family protein [Paenibacillus thalictri]
MNNDLNIQQYIEHYAHLVEQELPEAFPSEWYIPDPLKQSMLYSLMAGGKRLRPILLISAAEALGGNAEAALKMSCAVEMIHTYSLIHDDLPAMDNDDYRRGKLTNHKVFGEALAILAGDGLLTHAFHSIAQVAREFRLDAEQALSIVEELSAFSGARGMVGGQAADIQGEQGLTQLSELEYIHVRKTSDLIVFSLRAGGRIAGANERQLAALETFGHHIGLAFQIQDDILDLIGDEHKLGKPVKSDEKQHKVTYPYFIGIDESRRKMLELTEAGKEAIRTEIPDPRRLLQIADYLLLRDH